MQYKNIPATHDFEIRLRLHDHFALRGFFPEGNQNTICMAGIHERLEQRIEHAAAKQGPPCPLAATDMIQGEK